MQHPVSERIYQYCRQEIEHALQQQDGQGALQLPLFSSRVHDFSVSGAKHGDQDVEQCNRQDQGKRHEDDDDVCLIC